MSESPSSESPNGQSPNGDTVKKSLALVGAATAFVIGGFGITQLASAQTTDEDPTVEESDADADADTDADTDSDSDADNDADADAGDSEDGDREGHRGRKGDCGDKYEAVAETLGLTTDELRAEIEAGNSLADIAEANGVDSQELVDMMVAHATERVEAKVEAGDLTEAEATEKLADAEERAEEKINSTDGLRGRDGRGHRGERGDRDGGSETEDTDSADA